MLRTVRIYDAERILSGSTGVAGSSIREPVGMESRSMSLPFFVKPTYQAWLYRDSTVREIPLA